MFEVVEIPTGNIVATVETLNDGIEFIANIETFEGYESLKSIYGDTRRIQQELTISEKPVVD